MHTVIKIIIKLLSLVLIPIAFSYLFLYVIHIPAFSFDSKTIVAYMESFETWAPVIYILFTAATIPLVLVPDVIIATAGGILFGFEYSIIYTTFAWTVGTSINYYLSKLLGRPFLMKLLTSDEVKLLDKFTKHLGWKVIFVSWFVPGGTADVAGYAAGLTDIPFIKYLVAAFPAALLLAIFTSAAGAAISTNPMFVTLFTIAAIFGLVFGFKVVVIHQIIKHFFQKIHIMKG